jgi:DNA-binding NarL/FixJ family response regulator
MQGAMNLGVDGYLLKENAADELNDAIFTSMEGKTCFSAIHSKFEPSDSMVMTRLAREVAL